MLTGIALVGTITPAVSLSVNKNNTTQTTTSLSVLKNTPLKTIVDYSLVENMMNKLTPKLLNSNLNESKLTPEQEQKVSELQEQYLNLFKSNNYSLEEIQSYMCENFPQYKEEYEKQTTSLNKVEHVKKTILTKKIDPSKPLDPHVVEYLKSELKDKVPSLEKTKKCINRFLLCLFNSCSWVLCSFILNIWSNYTLSHSMYIRINPNRCCTRYSI